jgi:hypothetical protein
VSAGDQVSAWLRIVVAASDGQVIDVVECTAAELLQEVRRNPGGLLGGINPQLVESAVAR